MGRKVENGKDVRSACLNCHTPLAGVYCHSCGQKDQPAVLPLRAIAGESIAEVFSLDGRLFRTLRMLFRKPGFLTSEYLAGRRAAWVAPLRLYLLVSVVYFLVLGLTGFDTFFFAGSSPGSPAYRYTRLLPKVMFVILPAFALLLKLLYPRRLYFEHLVTSLHLHSITFALLAVHTILISTWDKAPSWLRLIVFILIDVPAQLAVFVYFFLTLRCVYGSSRVLTALKMVLLVFGYFGVLILIGATIINGNRLIEVIR
jgi:hypothetical protein